MPYKTSILIRQTQKLTSSICFVRLISGQWRFVGVGCCLRICTVIVGSICIRTPFCVSVRQWFWLSVTHVHFTATPPLHSIPPSEFLPLTPLYITSSPGLCFKALLNLTGSVGQLNQKSSTKQMIGHCPNSLKVTGLSCFKGNMHHKHDMSSKDAFYVTDIAAGIYFSKFCTIS